MNLIKNIFTGAWLHNELITKHYKYILFIIFLSIVYIANQYRVEAIIVKSGRLKMEMTELRAKYAFYTEKLMQISTELEVEKRLIEKGSNIRIQKQPPSIIKIKKDKENRK